MSIVYQLLLDFIHLDSASTRAMQDEIKLLNEKLVYLNDGSRRLHSLYDKSLAKVKNMQNELDTCEKQNQETLRVRAYSVTEMPSLNDDQSFWSFINKVYILSLFLGHPCKYETSYWRKNVKS